MSWGRFNLNPQRGPTRPWTRVFPAQKPPPRTVVVIDEDDDGDDASDSEVFIIDGAAAGESTSAVAAARCQARKGKGPSGNVINIDDDEDVKDGTGRDEAGPSMPRASGSPASMTPGRGSPGNRYGLDCTSDSSDSDLSGEWETDTDDGGSSDCEILDDTAGIAREMWETAASRKKPPRSECFFAPEYPTDESMFWFRSAASKYDSQNSSGGTKEGPGHAQSSADNTKGGHGPAVPNAKECSNGDLSSRNDTQGEQNRNSSAKDIHAECHLHDNISQSFSDACKEGLQNNTARSEGDHGQSSSPNVKECSNGKEGVGSGKASEGVQSPCLDENSHYNFVSAGRKDVSPPMSVSTPEKVDEKIPEDQSPPEAYYNTNIYSAQDDGPVRGKDLIQDPDELGQFASVIGEREKHKESVEYKRAAEEEWASRQRQLQIQAEEAKKLRKRKKAEAQRLLDMEKRQKQRLQEVRESQRKNEEAIELKEKYRGVVRKELEDMEMRHWDMTSLLRALGISVEGGEVKAFKQALLKFHPDRVSRNDIYQQVKAEETFKFISRLKEKLPRFS